MKRLVLMVVLAVLTGAGSCAQLKDMATNPDDISRLADKAQKVYKKVEDARADLTPDNELYLGRALSTRLLANYDYKYYDQGGFKKGRLEGLTQYVNNIGIVLVAAAMERNAGDDRPAPVRGWHFVVVKSPVVAAVSAPGGYVFVTDAAIKLAQSEDELAALLAHEIAHIVRGHALAAIKKSRWTSAGAEFVTAAAGELGSEQVAQLTEVMEGSIEDMAQTLVGSGYSKKFEFEADAIGAELLAAAGYEPGAMARYLGRLAKVQNTEGGMLSTHPPAQERISKLADKGSKEDPKNRTKRFQQMRKKYL